MLRNSIMLFLVIILFSLSTGCASQLAYLPRSGESYYWKKGALVTTGERSGTLDEMMDVITAEALQEPGKPVIWGARYDLVGGSGYMQLVAVSEEKELDGVRFVWLRWIRQGARGGSIPKTVRYTEVRTSDWKQPLCVKDSQGSLKMFFTKTSCKGNYLPGATFKEARAYHQQNKEKFSP